MIHSKRSIAIIAVLLFLIVGYGNSCSNDFKNIVQAPSSSSLGSSDQLPAETVIPGTKAAVVVDANRALSHLTACSGVTRPSDQTQQLYEAKKAAISASGTASTVTAPMLMAITNIAGEVCNDLIEQEKASPRMFAGVDFSANALPASGVMSDVINRLALSCWQRPPTSQESTLLLELSQTVGATEILAGRKATLMICTAMLASLDGILN